MYDRIFRSVEIASTALDFPGVSVRVLSGDLQSGATTVETTMAPGSCIPAHRHSDAEEVVYVISGDFVEAGARFGPGTVFVAKSGTVHGPHTTTGGCVVLTSFSAALDFEIVT